jgi:hypothetical protein
MEGGTQVPPLSFVDLIVIFPGIIAAASRIAAVEGPARPLKFAFAKGS